MSLEELRDEEVEVEVTEVAVTPNLCELSRELKLEMKYMLDLPLKKAVWELKVQTKQPEHNLSETTIPTPHPPSSRDFYLLHQTGQFTLRRCITLCAFSPGVPFACSAVAPVLSSVLTAAGRLHKQTQGVWYSQSFQTDSI